MAVELNELGEFVKQLAEKFRQTKKPNSGHFADMLSADAQKYQAQARIAIALGMPEFFSSQSDAKLKLEKTFFQLADLRNPDQFREYFIDSLGRFLGKEIVLSLPTQEYVDRGQRIKGSGFTTYEPVVFPNLTIKQDFIYPPTWEFPLDSWVYKQITEGTLKSDVLRLKEVWGWLDISPRLDWKIGGDPMFDPNMDKSLANLLERFREQKKIDVPDWCKHLDPRSPYGVSAVETKKAVYPSLAKIFGVKRGEVTDLTAAQFNFIGNWMYRHFGEKNSWEWFSNPFAVGVQLVGGCRVDGGLGDVYYFPSDVHNGDGRFRPLVLPSPGA